jgi:OOP family OmpA-OmpF porin
MKRNTLKTSIIVLAVAMSGPAFAGGYLGAGIGQASTDICDELFALGATSCDEEDTGFKFFGGYEMNQNIAIEGSYMDYGELDASDGSTSVNADVTALALSVKGMIPLNENFSIFAKLGAAFWEADASATGFGSIDEDGTDLIYGLGAEIAINKTFGVLGEWEQLDADGEDVDLLSISAIMRF